MRKLLRALVLVLVLGLGAVAEHGADRATAGDVPQSIVGIVRCGRFVGALVTTRDGVLHKLRGLPVEKADEIVKRVQKGSAVEISTNAGCDTATWGFNSGEADMAESEGGQLLSIGEVAGANIAAALGKPELAGEVTQAIADEINAMSTHFVLAFADIRTAYDDELAKTHAKVRNLRLALVALACAVAAAVGTLGVLAALL